MAAVRVQSVTSICYIFSSHLTYVALEGALPICWLPDTIHIDEQRWTLICWSNLSTYLHLIIHGTDLVPFILLAVLGEFLCVNLRPQCVPLAKLWKIRTPFAQLLIMQSFLVLEYASVQCAATIVFSSYKWKFTNEWFIRFQVSLNHCCVHT